jgi:hypothetical protein
MVSGVRFQVSEEQDQLTDGKTWIASNLYDHCFLPSFILLLTPDT